MRVTSTAQIDFDSILVHLAAMLRLSPFFCHLIGTLGNYPTTETESQSVVQMLGK